MKKVSFILLSCLLWSPWLTAAQDRPNILFFLVDDMGTQDTSVPFHYEDGEAVITDSNRLYRTPNLERLASQGVKFTQAYAYSVCSPTRVSLVTGQAAPRHKVTQWTHPETYKTEPGPARTETIKSPEWNTRGVPGGVPLLPRLLRDAGYRTIFAGKAHFGPDDTPNGDPLNLGFDVNIAGFGGGGPGSYWGKYNYSAEHRNGGSMWNVPGLEKYHGTDTFLTEALTLEMNEAIEKAVQVKQPFFAYMSHYAVHAPFSYPDARFESNYPSLKGSSLAFATLIEGMDKSLGDMMQKLEELGVAEETLIVFYSDNGSANPMTSIKRPLSGKKGTRLEGGMRVPLIVAWARPDPKNKLQQVLPIQPGSLHTGLVTCLDMMPTFLSLTGTAAPSDAILDGFDITPAITGKKSPQRPQKFLCHFPHRHANTLFTTYRSGNYKIIYQYASDKWELYNLKEDIGEKNNLISAKPDLAQVLAREMVAELDSQQARYPVSIQTGDPVKPKLKLD